MSAPADLRSLFHRLVLLASTLPAAAACGNTAYVGPAPDASTDGPRDVESRDVACPPRTAGPMAGCTGTVEVPCAVDDGTVGAPGFCQRICASVAGYAGACSVTSHTADRTVVSCNLCVGGRRPAGLRTDEVPPGGDDVGRFFARLAMIEGASVPAFERLAHEMQRLGAPDTLTMRCLDAADDERRHTVSMAALAARFGATPGAYAVDEVPVREALPVAVENAVEGCVYEAFGALLATWQATHATDRVVARAMTRIADDETRHANLAFAIARWFEGHLDDEARAQARTRRRAALDALRDELEREPAQALVQRAGMPTAAQALHLFEHFAQTLHGDAMA